MLSAGPPRSARDLRLDLFRGLALIFIFLNHIPGNVVSWISNRNYGFSDATEIFVFISGYSVVLAYGGIMARRGFLVATARIWGRVWQVYTAHVFLFVVFMAQIAYVSERFNPAFAEEMNITEIFEAPHTLMFQMLMLKYKPANMDVLPLYIVLLAAFPVVMAALQRWPHGVLGLSFLVWLGVQRWHWNVPAYPDGVWLFNPIAWQFLFVLGGWCAIMRREGPWRRLPVGPTAAFALAYLLLALAIVATWHYPPWSIYVPDWLLQVLYPIDKTELDSLRLVHFLAQAYLVTVLVRPDAPFLKWKIVSPLMLCGRKSLQVFCAGIFLAFLGQFMIAEIDPGLAMQVAVSLTGSGLLVGLAAFLTWYDRAHVDATAAPAPPGR